MVRLSPPWQKWLWYVLLAVATFAVFWPVRHNDFIEYDDNEYVYENPEVTAGWTWHGVVWAFEGAHSLNWHPVTWLSHMTDCEFFGVDPGAHHLVNVVIHCANALLLLWLLDSLTGKFGRSVLIAALFALHPLRVESVAWASERKDVLCAFFFLLTLLAYVRHVRAQVPGRPLRIGLELRLALLFYLLALMSKAMVVTLPVILLLLDFWPLQRISDLRTQFRGLLREKWPFFLLAAAFGVITVYAQRGVLPSQPATPGSRLAGMVTDYLSYLENIFWPPNLSFLDYRPPHLPPEQVLLAALVAGGMTAVALATWRRYPWLAFGWLWFVVMLLPVTAVTLGRLSIADRYTYLPVIGFMVMVIWVIGEAAPELFARRGGRVFATVAAGIIVALCVWQTREQISYWRNTGTLTEHALSLDPNNPVAGQMYHIYMFEQAHPGVREGHPAAAH